MELVPKLRARASRGRRFPLAVGDIPSAGLAIIATEGRVLLCFFFFRDVKGKGDSRKSETALTGHAPMKIEHGL